MPIIKLTSGGNLERIKEHYLSTDDSDGRSTIVQDASPQPTTSSRKKVKVKESPNITSNETRTATSVKPTDKPLTGSLASAYHAEFRYDGNLKQVGPKEPSWEPTIGDWVIAVEEFEEDAIAPTDVRKYLRPAYVINVHERKKQATLLWLFSEFFFEGKPFDFPRQAKGSYIVSDHVGRGWPWRFIAPWDGSERVHRSSILDGDDEDGYDTKKVDDLDGWLRGMCAKKSKLSSSGRGLKRRRSLKY